MELFKILPVEFLNVYHFLWIFKFIVILVQNSSVLRIVFSAYSKLNSKIRFKYFILNFPHHHFCQLFFIKVLKDRSFCQKTAYLTNYNLTKFSEKVIKLINFSSLEQGCICYWVLTDNIQKIPDIFTAFKRVSKGKFIIIQFVIFCINLGSYNIIWFLHIREPTLNPLRSLRFVRIRKRLF